MKYKVQKADKTLRGVIDLESSKSLSNRALIIRALCPESFEIKRLSEAKDTVTLRQLLESDEDVLDVGPAGTTMRFLTAYFSGVEGARVLTGSERMKQRPIHVLVNVLRQLGADIDYTEKEGFPPLKIRGKKLQGGTYHIDAGISSQYISALLMLGPVLPSGLKLVLEGKQVSIPYIEMTLRLMEYFGAVYKWEENTITIQEQPYKTKAYTVESDWSAASYWYEMAAFSNEVDLIIKGLHDHSLQGDRMIADIMRDFGVLSKFEGDTVHLAKIEPGIESFSGNFLRCPDLAQTVIVTCAGLGVSGTFSGLETLKIKETDRTKALQTELSKLDVEFQPANGSWVCARKAMWGTEIATYEDHRMAMAFAPLAIPLGEIVIDNPLVVEKSYPDYWNDLKKVGFDIIPAE